MDNLSHFKEDMVKLRDHVESAKTMALGVMPWSDSVAAVEDLSHDPSSTAAIHLSIIYGLKYAR